MNDGKKIKEFVRKRYGDVASGQGSCCNPCSQAGCTVELAKAIGYSKGEIESIPDDAVLGLGCGNPTALAGLAVGEFVLDLGSGAGIDAFLAAKKVGPAGRVVGVDMSPEMIERSMTLAEKNGYDNVEFRLGEIEKLPVEDESIDVVISNCVVNLSPDKTTCFREVFRVLKPGGRMHISDLVTEGELPPYFRENLDAWACCIAGAMPKEDYIGEIRNAGFSEVEIVEEQQYKNGELYEEVKDGIRSIHVVARKNG